MVSRTSQSNEIASAAVDADRGVVQGGLDEIGEHHSVAASLAGANGVKEASHDDGQLFFLPVGKRRNSSRALEAA